MWCLGGFALCVFSVAWSLASVFVFCRSYVVFIITLDCLLVCWFVFEFAGLWVLGDLGFASVRGFRGLEFWWFCGCVVLVVSRFRGRFVTDRG